MEYTGLEVAIIGMSCRFPMSNNIDEYWENIKNCKDCISTFTESELEDNGINKNLYLDSKYIKRRGIIEDLEEFDYEFFKYTPKDASIMDPQVRKFHECAYEALEDAGINYKEYKKSMGVYVGAANNPKWEFNQYHSKQASDFQINQLCNKEFMATRLAYKFNFTGPTIDISTMCSTSLAAIHLACQGLISGDCDTALVGGVSALLPQKVGYLYQEGVIFSSDGKCRAFDEKADGTVSSNGLGIVILKPLEDAINDKDNIYAVIKGTAMNNDGNKKGAYTAPSRDQQAKVIRDALDVSEVTPESIDYIEAHGTGTNIGDPIEISGLKKAFNTSKRNYCAVGSVKSNIGHTNVAAGIAGLIKTALALKNKTIPATINYDTPNPKLNIEDSPFYISKETKRWISEDSPRRAGVSSFGIGGTNVHVILEEYKEPKEIDQNNESCFLITLSADNRDSLVKLSNNYCDFLSRNKYPLIDIQYTSLLKREDKDYRTYAVGSDINDLISSLKKSEYFKQSTNNIVFMFSGQGSQYVNMAKELYLKFDYFKMNMDKCFNILKRITNKDFSKVIFDNEDDIYKTDIAQPLLFTLEYSIAKFLIYLNIIPSIMIGHSLGEYVASCISGVISLEDTLDLLVLRGKLMEKTVPGKMLSVNLSENEIKELLDDKINIAAINNYDTTVISGNDDVINNIIEVLDERSISYKKLKTTKAFHSYTMDCILKEYKEKIDSIKINKAKIPYISNLTGELVNDDLIMSSNYWCDHLRNTVQFKKGIETIINKYNNCCFIEVGPGNTLCNYVKQITQNTKLTVNILKRFDDNKPDILHLYNSLGKFWSYGLSIDFSKLIKFDNSRVVSLPNYVFKKQKINGSYKEIKSSEVMVRDKQNYINKPFWQEENEFSNLNNMPDEVVLLFMDSFGVGETIYNALKTKVNKIIRIYNGDNYNSTSNDIYTINEKDDFYSLFMEIDKLDCSKINIIYLFEISNIEGKLYNKEKVNAIMNMAKSIGTNLHNKLVNLKIVTNNLYNIFGNEEILPYKALTIGISKVCSVEYPEIISSHIDIDITNYSYFIDNLLNEINLLENKYTIAYRGNKRWIQCYKNIDIQKKEDVIKDNGVYLFTGGFGGMAFKSAEYFGKLKNCKLILLVRSDFPKRENYYEYIENNNDEISIKIKKIIEIEESGSSVEVINVDLTDDSKIRLVINMIEKKYGSINGIFHTAGIIDYGGVIQLRDVESIEKVISAKVFGIDSLLKTMNKNELEFIVLCSSLGNLLYSTKFGQAAYNAANEFLDFYSYYINKKYKNTHAITINWNDWSDVGMSVKALKNKFGNSNIDKEDELIDSITSSQGVEIIHKAISSNEERIIISTVDLNDLINKNTEKLKSFNNIINIDNYNDQIELSEECNIKETILNVWKKVLGFDHINFEDDFFEIGGDSLKIAEVYKNMNKVFPNTIKIQDLYNNKTINQLSDYIANRINTNTRIDNEDDDYNSIDF